MSVPNMEQEMQRLRNMARRRREGLNNLRKEHRNLTSAMPLQERFAELAGRVSSECKSQSDALLPDATDNRWRLTWVCAFCGFASLERLSQRECELCGAERVFPEPRFKRKVVQKLVKKPPKKGRVFKSGRLKARLRGDDKEVSDEEIARVMAASFPRMSGVVSRPLNQWFSGRLPQGRTRSQVMHFLNKFENDVQLQGFVVSRDDPMNRLLARLCFSHIKEGREGVAQNLLHQAIRAGSVDFGDFGNTMCERFNEEDLLPLWRLVYMHWSESRSDLRIAASFHGKKKLASAMRVLDENLESETRGQARSMGEKLFDEIVQSKAFLQQLGEVCEERKQDKKAVMDCVVEAVARLIDKEAFVNNFLVNLCFFHDHERMFDVSRKKWEEILNINDIHNWPIRWSWVKEVFLNNGLLSMQPKNVEGGPFIKAMSKIAHTENDSKKEWLSKALSDLAEADKQAWDVLQKFDFQHEKYNSQEMWRQDKIEHGVVSEMTEESLMQIMVHSDVAGYNPLKAYDYGEYLSKLIRRGHIIQPEFKVMIRNMAGSYGRIRFGPVKTAERVRIKSENDYAECPFPTSAQCLDIIRGSITFDRIRPMVSCLQEWVDRHGTAKGPKNFEIVRIKNGFHRSKLKGKFPTRYCDVKVIAAITCKDPVNGVPISLLSEVQFLLSPMLSFKKLQHELYEIIRLEDFFMAVGEEAKVSLKRLVQESRGDPKVILPLFRKYPTVMVPAMARDTDFAVRLISYAVSQDVPLLLDKWLSEDQIMKILQSSTPDGMNCVHATVLSGNLAMFEWVKRRSPAFQSLLSEKMTSTPTNPSEGTPFLVGCRMLKRNSVKLLEQLIPEPQDEKDAESWWQETASSGENCVMYATANEDPSSLAKLVTMVPEDALKALLNKELVGQTVLDQARKGAKHRHVDVIEGCRKRLGMGVPEEVKRDEQKESQRIDEEIRAEKQMRAMAIEMVVLGGPNSGKSTIFKCMMTMHGDSSSAEEVRVLANDIRMRVLVDMQNLCVATLNLGRLKTDFFVPDDSVRSLVERFASHDLRAFRWSARGVRALERVWADETVQKVLRAKTELAITSRFFMEDLSRIASHDFRPTHEDSLRFRPLTAPGVTTQRIPVQHRGRTWHLFVNVPGALRCERKRWMPMCQGMDVAMLVFNMACYDQNLYEDESVNALDDTLMLIEEFLHTRWLRECDIHLVWNKDDLFEAKLERVPFRCEGFESRDSDAVRAWLRDRVLRDADTTHRDIHVHFTCATNTHFYGNVMQAVIAKAEKKRGWGKFKGRLSRKS